MSVIPAGSIGPNRARCLDRLRRYPAIAALISAEAETGSPVALGGLSAARIPLTDEPAAARPPPAAGP